LYKQARVAPPFTNKYAFGFTRICCGKAYEKAPKFELSLLDKYRR